MLNKVDLNDERIHAQEWKACIPVDCFQFGGIESSIDEVNSMFPKELEPSILANDFILSVGDTMELTELLLVMVYSLERLLLMRTCLAYTTETIFVTNHVLGTLESFASRDDSRFVDRVLSWEHCKTAGGEKYLSDELRPWLSGFIKEMGTEESCHLLANAGQLQTQTFELPRCILNFFCLPRIFKTIALPSIVQNILLPNAKYNCDIVVHYYKIDFDDSGIFNCGGNIDTDALDTLVDISEVIATNAGKSPPAVIIVGETKEEFLKEYSDLIEHYQTFVDPNSGKLRYFPWADASYKSGQQLKSIIMQWKSINKAWDLMENHSKKFGSEYKRVAFFCTDAFYATPVDIFKVDKDTFDYSNWYVVIPGFA